jgi:threonine dehydrogenase-like Zn-dependent dehydrogenase
MPRELVLAAPGRVELREYSEPALGPGQLRIRTRFAAPKHGTESHAFRGDPTLAERIFDPEYRMFLPAPERRALFPRAVGNMAVGEVVEVARGVRGFAPGDAVYGHLPIRETHTVDPAALRGKSVPLWSGARESRIHHLPEGMSPQQAVLLDPAHFALAAVRDAQVRIGERVAVFGLGAVGLLALQMARLSGAEAVFAVDPLASRRRMAERFGADMAYDPAACDAAYEIKRATGKQGVDVAIEASGAYRALHEAIRAVHYSGLVVTVSFYHGGGAELRLGEEWHHTRVTVRSSMPVWGNPSRDHPLWDDERVELTALSLMQRNRLSTEGIVGPVVPLEQAAEAYREALEHPESSIKLGVTFGGGA